VFVDPHVHLRDFRQRDKETVKHGLEVARDSGLDAVFDMPNTDPPIVSEREVRDRLDLAREANVPEVFYGMYVGATADPEQLKRAVELTRRFREVVGVKLFAGESVGNLAVIEEEDQRVVYGTLAGEGYDGVLFVHPEKESCMNRKLWVPSDPRSHCEARPPRAEIESIRDQIRFVVDAGFKGKLHIAHISTPEGVHLVDGAKINGVDVSCGVCPHHFIYDERKMEEPEGIKWKMNPPLRRVGDPELMLNLLKEGKIDFIETDHAPHRLGEKIGQQCMSGVPGLPWWGFYSAYLEQRDFSGKRIREVTRDRALERFGIEVGDNVRRIVDRRGDYAFNTYDGVDGIFFK